MKLYTGPLSLFSAKVRIALDEKGLDFDHVSVGWSPEQRYLPHHPDVVALNPKRQVPVLVDGDVVVCDSTLILEYLEDRFPEIPLLPGDAAGRARCRHYEWWADEVVFPSVWDLIEEVFYPAAGERDGARAGSALAELGARHRELDAALGDREYVCGVYSFADLALYVMLRSAATLGATPDPALSRLFAWLERTGARPAVERDTDAMQTYAARILSGATQAPSPERRAS